MRKRINRACIASSENYSSSKKAHKAMLKENHDNNNKLFLMINTSTTPKLSPLMINTSTTPKLSPLEENHDNNREFELRLKSQIKQFKARRYG